MGFSAMKLINEAGMRGAAVISAVQPSARSLVSSRDEGRGPFNAAAFPGGPKGQAGLQACFIPLQTFLVGPWPPSLAGTHLGRKIKGERGEARAHPLASTGADLSLIRQGGQRAAQEGRYRTGLAARSPLPTDTAVPGGLRPRLESIFSPNRFYSSFKVICQIIFPIYIVNESNPTNSF